jgi:carboxymethylenebutenolidase
MCYDDEARPPVPPSANGHAHGEDLVLTAIDGNRFAAYLAKPAQGIATGSQIVIYPDVRGLFHFYKELALRFAEVGITALAFDYFGRTAGLTSRAEGFDHPPHVQQLTATGLFADIRACLAQLDAHKPTFVIGFCMGGTISIFSMGQDLGLAGAIGFYAGLKRDFGTGTFPLEAAKHAKIPFLGLFGGSDPGIPVPDVQQLDKNLDESGVEHEIVIYDNATHSFFDKKFIEYADACNDAWTRLLGFIQQHSA